MGGPDRARVGAEQRKRLVEWASLNGRLSDAREEGGDDFCGYLQLEGLVAGNEHAVIFPEVECDPVIKITHADCFGKAYPRVDGIPKHRDATPLEYFTRQLLSNEVFSDDVRLERVILDFEGAIRVVTTQPFVVGTQPQQNEVHDAMRDLGFEPFESVDGEPMTNDWFRESDRVLAFDCHAGNYIKTRDGWVLAIDIYVERV